MGAEITLSAIKLTRGCPRTGQVHALGTRIDSPGPHAGSRLRLCGWNRAPSPPFDCEVGCAEGRVGWRGPLWPPSVSPACVCPGQRSTLLKGTKGAATSAPQSKAAGVSALAPAPRLSNLGAPSAPNSEPLFPALPNLGGVAHGGLATVAHHGHDHDVLVFQQFFRPGLRLQILHERH